MDGSFYFELAGENEYRFLSVDALEEECTRHETDVATLLNVLVDLAQGF